MGSVGAAGMAAGPNALRGSGPGQKHAFDDAVDGSSTGHASAVDLGAGRTPTTGGSYPCKWSRLDRENPLGSSHLRVRANDWDPIRAEH